MKKVLMIVPAFNEEEAIANTVKSIFKNADVDVLVVNDGSSDDTQKILENLHKTIKNLSVVQLPINCGIGVAVQTGFIFAKERKYKFAIQFDGDGQHCAESINKLIEVAENESFDLCVGSRYIELDNANFKSTPLRRLGILFFSKLIAFLTGTTVKDTTSGFRIYGEKVINRFADYYPDDYPEPEALFWCVRNKLNVGEISIKMYERQGGVSSIQNLKSLYYMIKVTIAILLDRMRGMEL